MPGLKIVVGPPPSSRPRPDAERFAPEVPFERIEVFAGPRTELTFEASAHHPHLTCPGPDFLLFVEGLVYDRSDEELRAFAAALACKALAGDPVEETVQGFVTGTDGEYVFVLVLEGGARVIAFNDAWGRLPLYAAQSPSRFLLGREPQDLLPHLPEIRFDRRAITEWLAFEYTLNPEWVVQGLAQVPPATLFDVSARDGDVRVARTLLLPQDFTLTDPVRGRREAARRYSELYLEGYATRVARLKEKGYRLTADLSGGFDTRYVFAGARRLDVPMEFYTDELVTGDESATAARLAEVGNVPVVRVPRGPAIRDEAEWRRLIYLSGGRVNYDTMLGALLAARARRRVVPGRAARFMGFVGELVRHPYVRPRGYRSFQDAMADDVYTRFIRIREGSRLVGLDPAEVHRHMAGAVERWSERNDTDRARRLYFQYWYGLGQMGEDRHRWHFWTVTPILANRVLDFTYHGIGAGVVGYPFFVELLRTVYPKSLEAPLHRNPMRLTSRRQVLQFTLKEAFLARLRNTRDYRRLRAALAPRERWATLATPERFAWYREQFDSAFRESAAVRATFDERAVRAWVHPGQATHRLNQLLTSISLVAEVGRRFSTLRTDR
jgi:hypothetical protein